MICMFLANTSVFPSGSRCASQPCQNGGVCFDFRSADGYICQCPYPYKGLHCHTVDKPYPKSGCGRRIGTMSPGIRVFTTDMALDYTCGCHDWSRRPVVTVGYVANNCHTEKIFFPECEEVPRVGALPFTNKGFYVCQINTNSVYIQSCLLHHVWNDTQKECVLDKN